MSHAVDAAMLAQHRPAADPTRDLTRRQAGGEQLRPRHDTMLPTGDSGEFPVLGSHTDP
jgi:hypothetical protein